MDVIPPENLLFLPEPPVSPYLTRPQRGTWEVLPDGSMLHVETGSIWRAKDGLLLNGNTAHDNVLESEIILDDILDAEVIE